MSDRAFFLSGFAILALALGLRLYAAADELWLDEIWTETLVSTVRSPDQIFWKISHSNNHYLNSLWLYVVGIDSSPLLRRAPSVAFGVGTVTLAGLWTRVRGRHATLAAMLLFATPLVLVQYDSEARGYAGLAFFTVATVVLCERAMQGRPHRIAMALAGVLGILSQLMMVQTVFLMASWAFWVGLRRSDGINGAARFAVRTLWPLLLGSGLLTAGLLVIWHFHPFDLGPTRIAPITVYEAYAALASGTGTLPISIAGGIAGVLAFATIGIVYTHAGQPEPDKHTTRRTRLPLYLLALLGLPLLAQAALPFHPSRLYPRYFLPSIMIYLLFLADLCGEAIQQRGRARQAGLVLLAALTISNGLFDKVLLSVGRGHYAEAIGFMASSGPVRYGDRSPGLNVQVVDHYARREGVSVTLVPDSDLPAWCNAPPDWYLAHDRSRTAPGFILAGPEGCSKIFQLDRQYPSSGFSGMTWWIYHRTN